MYNKYFKYKNMFYKYLIYKIYGKNNIEKLFKDNKKLIDDINKIYLSYKNEIIHINQDLEEKYNELCILKDEKVILFNKQIEINMTFDEKKKNKL